jgi:hypothetical protein
MSARPNIANGGPEEMSNQEIDRQVRAVDGRQAESGAPQLIVFRLTPQGWQVVAAANFARLLN